nr:uncharacterized protein LOC112928073 isoform X4 [Vulpes vulpes]
MSTRHCVSHQRSQRTSHASLMLHRDPWGLWLQSHGGKSWPRTGTPKKKDDRYRLSRAQNCSYHPADAQRGAKKKPLWTNILPQAGHLMVMETNGPSCSLFISNKG